MTCSMCKKSEHKMLPSLKDRDPGFYKYMCDLYPGFEKSFAFPLTIENGTLKRKRSRSGITVHLCLNCISQLKMERKRYGVFTDVIDKLFIVDKFGNAIYKGNML